jgi:hypothetical protein
MEVMAIHPPKTSVPMVVAVLEGISMPRSALHDLKALSPKDTTEGGIVIAVSDVQSSNAFVPMLGTPGGMTTLVRAPHWANAKVPRLDTDGGRTMLGGFVAAP